MPSVSFPGKKKYDTFGEKHHCLRQSILYIKNPTVLPNPSNYRKQSFSIKTAAFIRRFRSYERAVEVSGQILRFFPGYFFPRIKSMLIFYKNMWIRHSCVQYVNRRFSKLGSM